jgi:biopolymer transport protein ExbD
MRTRRPAYAFAAPSYPPIASLNTTPLIDVMLVLLIMFIVTIPIATHSVKIDLPAPGPTPPEEPEIHRLALAADGGLSWDGAPIVDAALAPRLAAFARTRPEGVLQLQAEAQTRYERFDTILAVVKRAGIAKLGFVGNERFAAAP